MKYSSIQRSILSALCLFASVGMLPAATFTVTTLADENNGTADPAQGTGTSLREAISAANAAGGSNTIERLV